MHCNAAFLSCLGKPVAISVSAISRSIPHRSPKREKERELVGTPPNLDLHPSPSSLTQDLPLLLSLGFASKLRGRLHSWYPSFLSPLWRTAQSISLSLPLWLLYRFSEPLARSQASSNCRQARSLHLHNAYARAGGSR